MSGPYRLASTSVTLRTAPANPFYVNTVTGTTGGTGRSASPVDTLSSALATCAGWPDQVIRVTAPATAPLRAQVSYESSLALTIEGDGGVPWYAYGSDQVTPGGSGAGPIYSRVVGTVGGVTVYTMTETIGGRSWLVKLVPNTTTPTTPSPGQFGYSGGTLYVQLPDSSSANSHTMELHRRNVASLWTTGFGLLTVRNLVARHGITTGILSGLSTQPVGIGNMLAEDCEFSYNEAGFGTSGVNELATATRCKGYRNANDGFNHHAPSGGAGVMVLNNCDGSFNGDAAGQSAQGCSNHETTTMIVNGGTYNYNVSGGMVVINQARCDLHGDTPNGPITMDRNMRLGNTAGTIASQAGCAWLDTSVGAVTGPVTVSNGQGVGVRTAVAGAVTGLGNITSTGNAQPNVIA